MTRRDRPVNSTAAALLGFLHEGPMSGWDLVAVAEERIGDFWTVTRSQVYRELPALAAAGLLRLGKRGPRASQQYVITPAGRRAFRSWLNSPPGADHLRNPLILRLVHAEQLTGKQRAALVSAARAEFVARLERARQEAEAAVDPYLKAVAEFAVDYRRAMLRLLDAIPTE